ECIGQPSALSALASQSGSLSLENRVGGTMAAPDRAFDRSRQSGVDPVTREVEASNPRDGLRTWGLPGRERKRRVTLANDRRAKEPCGPDRWQSVDQLVVG